jgi:hypothetical protein
LAVGVVCAVGVVRPLTGVPQAWAEQAETSPVTWQAFAHVAGVFDVTGPRRDGRLVVAAATHLVLMDRYGTATDFAPGYTYAAGSESYLALSTGQAVDGASCTFAPDDVFALDVGAATPGITRISAEGTASRFATVVGVTTLSAIAFDTVGSFGHRLLVTGPPTTGRTKVFAVDCQGTVSDVATVDAALEGGVAVAPSTFEPFGGQLIAPDENAGKVYAVSTTGELHSVANSNLPAGGDVGVESAGFAPAGSALTAFVADRGTPNNAHPGTDTLLLLTNDALRSVDVRASDLLVATEGGATVLRIRCTGTCSSDVIATGSVVAHAEGRLLVVTGFDAAPSPEAAAEAEAAARSATHSSSSDPAPYLIVAGVAVVLVVVAVVVLRSRRRSARATTD